MAHVLKQLLGNDHPLFMRNLMQLEHAAGSAGIDIRLIADITEKTHAILRELNLDPSDSHGNEVYQALLQSVKTGKAHELLHDASYVLLDFYGDIVSFNLQDVVENAHHELPYEKRTSAHGLRHLRAEIIRRYADHDRTDNELVHRLAEEIGVKLPEDEGHPQVSVVDASEDIKKPRILAIGDIFTDAFIKLRDDSARIDTDPDGTKRLSLPYGSKPAYDHVDIVKSVGPSPNAAVSMSRLGIDAHLMAWVGDDQPGVEALEHLAEEKVSTDQMITQPGAKTSYWYVLWYQSDRTMLVKSEAYDYKWTDPVEEPEWIYLSYIGEDSWPLHEKLIEYLDAHPDVKLVFQPGTFHFKWGIDKLRDLYAHAYLVVMNREEAMEVTGKGYDSLRDLTSGIHELGPKVAVITDGPNGSYASYDDKLVTIPNYPDPAPPLDRTGAGDAFASTIVAALALGETMDTALTWAPINSMSVVQELGAQRGLLKLDKLKKYLDHAPENYKVTEVQE